MKNVFLLIGRCYYQLGRNLEAIEDAEVAIQQNCESVAAREALAQALYSDGQFEKALIQVSSNNPTTQLITIVDKKLQKHTRLPARFFPDLLLQQLHSRYEAAISFFLPRSGVR